MKITRQGAYGDQHEHVYLGLLWFSLKWQDKVPIVTLNEVEKVNLYSKLHKKNLGLVGQDKVPIVQIKIENQKSGKGSTHRFLVVPSNFC